MNIRKYLWLVSIVMLTAFNCPAIGNDNNDSAVFGKYGTYMEVVVSSHNNSSPLPVRLTAFIVADTLNIDIHNLESLINSLAVDNICIPPFYSGAYHEAFNKVYQNETRTSNYLASSTFIIQVQNRFRELKKTKRLKLQSGESVTLYYCQAIGLFTKIKASYLSQSAFMASPFMREGAVPVALQFFNFTNFQIISSPSQSKHK